MSIRVECQGCGRKFQAPEKLAGRRTKCPKCSAVIQVGARPLQPSEQVTSGEDSVQPIPVTCGCGKKFWAKAELAGKRVKCPACGDALAIAAEQPDQPCPACGKLLSSGTVLCVDCGYHLLRRKAVRPATAEPSLDADSDIRRDSDHRRRGAVFGKALCRVSVAILVGVLGGDSDEEKRMSWTFLGAFVGGLAGFFVAKYLFGGFHADEYNFESVAAALLGAPVGAVLGWIGGARFADYLDSRR